MVINVEGLWRRIASPFEGEADFGAAVALSLDGTTLVVGAPLVRQDAGSGAVVLYRLRGNQLELWATLVAPAPSLSFGAAVSVNSDGRRVLVGCPGNAASPFASGGTAWLFSRASDGGFVGRVVPGSAARPPGARFGASVAYAALSDRFAVGAPEGLSVDAGRSGIVEVYSFDGGEIAAEQVIDDSRLGSQDFFGDALALSSGGTTMLVGAPGDDSLDTSDADTAPDAGMALSFVRSGSGWARQWLFKAQGGGRPGGGFGGCLALDASGAAAVIAGDDGPQTSFNAQLRGFGVWTAGPGALLPRASTRRSGCAVAGNGEWAFGAQDGRVTVLDLVATEAPRQLTKPAGAGATLGQALAAGADASVVVMGEPGASDGGAVWLLFR